MDANAHVEGETRLAQRVKELEEELEEIALGLLVADRIAARDRGEGALGKPVERVARELGLGDLVESA